MWKFIIALCASLMLISSCGSKSEPPSRVKSYGGPIVDHLVIYKSKRILELRSRGKVVKKYKFHLGFNPQGHKFREGDGRTPEGVYYIDRKNVNSSYHLSVGISYPNARDVAVANSLGVSPGGDIFIHGGPVASSDKNKKDWTAGCIAVTNSQIEEIFSMVRVGTRITIAK